MTRGLEEWGNKKTRTMERICFLGQALNQKMSAMGFVLGKSTERGVNQCGFWCVVVAHAWLVPCFHSNDDC